MDILGDVICVEQGTVHVQVTEEHMLAEELEAVGELAEGLETAAVPGAELRGREVIHPPDEVRSADVFFTQGFQDPGTSGVHVVEESVEKFLHQAVPLRVGEVQPQAVGLLGGDSVVVWVSAGHRAFFLVRPGTAMRRRGKRLEREMERCEVSSCE